MDARRHLGLGLGEVASISPQAPTPSPIPASLRPACLGLRPVCHLRGCRRPHNRSRSLSRTLQLVVVHGHHIYRIPQTCRVGLNVPCAGILRQTTGSSQSYCKSHPQLSFCIPLIPKCNTIWNCGFASTLSFLHRWYGSQRRTTLADLVEDYRLAHPWRFHPPPPRLYILPHRRALVNPCALHCAGHHHHPDRRTPSGEVILAGRGDEDCSGGHPF